MSTRGKVKFVKGSVWTVKNGDRKGVDDLQAAMDQLSDMNCFGLNSCESSLKLIDQVTGNIGVITVSNGEIVLTMIDPATGEPV